jgi:hypothetical protein
MADGTKRLKDEFFLKHNRAKEFSRKKKKESCGNFLLTEFQLGRDLLFFYGIKLRWEFQQVIPECAL